MLGWGQFLNFVVNFAIVAFVLFLVVKGMNRMKAQLVSAPPPAPKAPPAEVVLLTEIRDLLKK